MPYPQPGDSQHLRPCLCPECRTLLGLINDQGELVICAVRIPEGTRVYCLACGLCIVLKEADNAESGGN